MKLPAALLLNPMQCAKLLIDRGKKFSISSYLRMSHGIYKTRPPVWVEFSGGLVNYIFLSAGDHQVCAQFQQVFTHAAPKSGTTASNQGLSFL